MRLIAAISSIFRRKEVSNESLCQAHREGYEKGVSDARAEIANDIANIIVFQRQAEARGMPTMAISGYDPERDSFLLFPVTRTITIN